jgi:hypothetical protein
VDTVGFDLNPKNFAFLDKSLRGKYIVFLFLTNDLRIDTSLDSISEKLGCKPSDVWVCNAFGYHESHPEYTGKVMTQIECVQAFKNGELTSKVE